LGKTITKVTQPETQILTTDKSKQYANDLEINLRKSLNDLSQLHIFQWSTFYRDSLQKYFLSALDSSNQYGIISRVSEFQHKLFSIHSKDIFTKGFIHQTCKANYDPQDAVTKSIVGLQRFLELPIEFYSARAPLCATSRESRNLIRTTSSIISGIIEGYGNTLLGKQSGWQILPRYPRSWAHSLGFLTKAEALSLLNNIEQGDFRSGLSRTLPPLLGALEILQQKNILLPVLAQMVWDSRARRLDISLRPPRQSQEMRFIDIQCHLDQAFTSLNSLEEAHARRIALVLASLRPDLNRVINEKANLRKMVLEAREEKDCDLVQKHISDFLEAILYQITNPITSATPITYNFAREFPLRNPYMMRYYHVPRSSVNSLLKTFERRNGIRLWCSVRRSGKTTACFDLGTTTGSSTIVSQTCDTTHQQPESSIFYDFVCDAINSGIHIGKSAFSDLVCNYAMKAQGSSERYVFVLDEYETFFGFMKTAVRTNQSLRYTVVQPLLNQIVAFARENLVVFLGQHPDAHYILMDQNQLSAYIEQDSFPLFTHNKGENAGEFYELVQKVLASRFNLTPDFIDSLYEETAGHPFLTVNLLVDFVDWLIGQNWTMGQVHFDANIFDEFSRSRLHSRAIGISKEYDFFSHAIMEATGFSEKENNPWLYTIYNVMRAMAFDSSRGFRLSRSDYDDTVERMGLQDKGIRPDRILSTGIQGNFFIFERDEVRPKIRLLARIAAVSSPAVLP